VLRAAVLQISEQLREDGLPKERGGDDRHIRLSGVDRKIYILDRKLQCLGTISVMLRCNWGVSAFLSKNYFVESFNEPKTAVYVKR
jgi:hypothetical protein